MSADGLLTPADLAEKLVTTEAQVMEWRRSYDWPHVRLGRKVRFTDQQVEAIIAAHSVRPTKKTEAPVKIAGQTSRSARRAS